VRRWGARRTRTAGLAQATPRRAPPRPFSFSTVGALLVACCALSGCISIPVPFGGRAPLEEIVVDGTSGPKVLLLDIEGVLTEAAERGLLGFGERESIVARVRSQLDRARQDPEVRAVVLRIHSPGGSVTASDVLYHEILRFKRERNVPVIAQLMGVAASGGYYVAMAADAVYAHPTTITGSIGVIFSGVSFAGLLEKLGIEDQTVKSGERKDTGSALRRMTAAERAQLQSVIDALHGRFREVVTTGRAGAGLSAERVRELSDGRIYVASQALDARLVDGIAYLPDTIEETKRRAGLAAARVILYQRGGESEDANVYSQAPDTRRPSGGAPGGAVRDVPRELRVELGVGPAPAVRGPAFLYLWAAAD
jgi:protease-4